MLRYEAISSQDFSAAAMICILILLSKEIDSEFNSYRRNQCKEGSIEFSLIVYTAQCQLKCLKAQDKCKMLFGIILDLCMCVSMRFCVHSSPRLLDIPLGSTHPYSLSPYTQHAAFNERGYL